MNESDSVKKLVMDLASQITLSEHFSYGRRNIYMGIIYR